MPEFYYILYAILILIESCLNNFKRYTYDKIILLWDVS